MEGLEDSDERGFYALDVEIVRLLNSKGIVHVRQLAAALNVSYQRAQSLLCPTYLVLIDAIALSYYLVLMRYLGLDMLWLHKKIIKSLDADERARARIKERRTRVVKRSHSQDYLKGLPSSD